MASSPLRPPPTASQYSRSRTCFRLCEDDLRPPEDVLRPAAEVRAAQRCFLCGEPRPGPTPARPFLRTTSQEDGARACRSAGPHASGRSWTGMPSKRGHVRGGTSHRSRRRPPWKRGSPPDADAFSAPPHSLCHRPSDVPVLVPDADSDLGCLCQPDQTGSIAPVWARLRAPVEVTQPFRECGTRRAPRRWPVCHGHLAI